MQTKRSVIVVLAACVCFVAHETLAFYNPSTGRWLNRDPVEDSGFSLVESSEPKTTLVDAEAESAPIQDLRSPPEHNLYCFVSNEPGSVLDALGLWEFRCRLLAGLSGVTGQRHCWIECGGHSYSLLRDKAGNAEKKIDDPRDRGKGKVVAQGPGRCKCIAWQFKWNSEGFPYDMDQCNSNYFANSILACCGIHVSRPGRAYGWDDCNDGARSVQCVCYSGIVN